MKVSKGRSQPEMVAAGFLILYIVLGRLFLYQVLITTQVGRAHGTGGSSTNEQVGAMP